MMQDRPPIFQNDRYRMDMAQRDEKKMVAQAERLEELEHQEYWQMQDIAANQVLKTDRKLDLNEFTHKVTERTSSWSSKRNQWEASL
jgi:hypothetical protein